MKVKVGVLLIVMVLLTLTVAVNAVYAYGTCAFCQRISVALIQNGVIKDDISLFCLHQVRLDIFPYQATVKDLNWAFASVGNIGLRDGSYQIDAEVDEYKSKSTTFILGTTLFTYVSDGGAYMASGSASGFVGGYDIIFDQYRSDSDSDSN